MANEYDEIIQQEDNDLGVNARLNEAKFTGNLNEYDFIIGEEQQNSFNQFKQSLDVASKKSPDAMAEALKVEEKIGIPAFSAEKNLERLRNKLSAQTFEDAGRKSPRLAKWAEKPEYAAIGKDDTDRLVEVENIVNRIGTKDKKPSYFKELKEGAQSGTDQLQASYYMLLANHGTIDNELAASAIVDFEKKQQFRQSRQPLYIKEFNKALQKEGEDVDKAFGRFFTAYDRAREGKVLDALTEYNLATGQTILESLDYIGEALKNPRATSVAISESLAFSAPALAGGATGAAGGTAVAGPYGAVAGGVAGTFLGSASTEAGAWQLNALRERGYDLTDREQVLSALSNPILMEEIRQESYRKGLTVAAVDAATLYAGRFLKIGKGVGATAKQKVKSKAAEIALETVGEGVGETLSQAAAKKDIREAKLSEGLFESIAALGQSAAQTTILEAPVSAVKKGKRIVEEKTTPQVSEERQKLNENPVIAAKEMKEMLDEASVTALEIDAIDELGENARQSKTQTRSPEAYKKLVEGDRQTSIFFQSDDWISFWRERGESPVAKAEELLGSDMAKKVAETIEAGGVIEVPLGDYINNYAEDVDTFNGLQEIVTTSENGINRRDANKFVKEVPVIMKQLQKEARVIKKQRDEDSKIAKEYGNKIKESLRAAGRKPMASIFYEEGIKAFAARLNVRVKDVVAQYGLRIGDVLDKYRSPLQDETQAALIDNLSEEVYNEIRGEYGEVSEEEAQAIISREEGADPRQVIGRQRQLQRQRFEADERLESEKKAIRSPLKNTPEGRSFNQKVRELAREYARRAGLPYRQQKNYVKVDIDRAERIADAFDKMEHNPNDPEVKAAYNAMIKETLDQYQLIKDTGLEIEVITPDMEDPYGGNSQHMIADVVENNHMWLYPTESGFGTLEEVESNPLLQLTDEYIGDFQLTANDIFRIVHDYFGHVKEGTGFRARGEENAWQSHVRMYSPLAARAMTTETRGQNSWLNYGPYGEKNRTAKTEDTVFATQKIGLLPEWVMRDGLDEEAIDTPANRTLNQLKQDHEAKKKMLEEIGVDITKPDVDELGFISRLEYEIINMGFKTIPVKDLMARIKKTPGLKKEEIAYYGIEEWLELKEGKVSMEEVIKFIRGKTLTLDQVVRGEAYGPEVDNSDAVTEVDWGEQEFYEIREGYWDDQYEYYYDFYKEQYENSNYEDSAFEDAVKEVLAKAEDPEEIGSMYEEKIYSLIDDFARDNADSSQEFALENEDAGYYSQFRVYERNSGFHLEGNDEIGWYSPDTNQWYEMSLSEAQIQMQQHMIENGDLVADYRELIKPHDVDWYDPLVKYLRGPRAKALIEKLIEEKRDEYRKEVLENNSWIEDPNEEKDFIERQMQGLAQADASPILLDPTDEKNTIEVRIKNSYLEGKLIGNDVAGYSYDITRPDGEGVEGETGEGVTLEEAKQIVIKDLVDTETIGGAPVETVPTDSENNIYRRADNKPKKSQKWQRFTIEGGENYREFLITAPNLGPKKFRYDTHYPEDNILVFIRVTDRYDEQGNKYLYIEEIQSDWHQQARDRGYDVPLTDEEKKKVEDLTKQLLVKQKEAELEYERTIGEARKKYRKEYDNKEKEYVDRLNELEKQLTDARGEVDTLFLDYVEARDEKEKYKKEVFDITDEVEGYWRDNVVEKIAGDAINAGVDRQPAVRFAQYVFELMQEFHPGKGRHTNFEEALKDRIRWHNEKVGAAKEIDDAWVNSMIDVLNNNKDLFLTIESMMSKAVDASIKSNQARKRQDELGIAHDRADEKLREIASEKHAIERKLKYETFESYLLDNDRVDLIAHKKLDNEANKLQRELNKIQRPNPVPDAPFKDTDAWVALGLKRIITVAAQEGHTKVAWSPAIVHQDRWGTDRIAWQKDPETGEFVVNSQEQVAGEVDGINIEEEAASRGELKKLEGERIKDWDDLREIIGNTLDRDRSPQALDALADRVWDLMQKQDRGQIEPRKEGLENHYNKRLPKVAEKVVKSLDKTFKDLSVSTVKESKKYNKAKSFDITPAIKGVVDSKGMTMYQKKGGDARGQIRFSPNLNDNVITLLKDANESTFIHELGHYFLEIYKDVYNNNNTPQEVRDDFDAIMDWLGVENPEDITVEHHEKWARGFESYIREGKAPNNILRKAFNYFKVFLRNIYQTAEELDVELSDEIRGVMGRILAADVAVDNALNDLGSSRLFSDPIRAGMTQAQAERYEEAIEQADMAAREKLISKIMKQLDKKQTKQYKEEERAVRKQVEEDANEMRIYKIISHLRNNKKPDGSSLESGVEPMKISKDSLLYEYDKDFLALLPKGIYTTKDTGIDYEHVATIYGYDSGDDMLTELINTPSKKDFIEKETQRIMAERTGDFMTLKGEEELRQEAEMMVHNDMRAKRIRLEYEHLASNHPGLAKEITKRVTRRPAPDSTVRAAAKERIQKTNINKISSNSFRLAERRYAKLAGEALSNGDIDAAFKHKQKELFNHYLYQEAANAKNDIKKKLDKSKNFFKKDKDLAKYRDMDLVNAGRAILARYGLGKSDKLPLEYLEGIKKYNPEGYEAISAIITGIMEDPKPYNELTYEEFYDLMEAINSLWDLSKAAKEVEVDGKRVSIEQANKELIAQMQKHKSKNKKKRLSHTATEAEKRKFDLLGVRSWLRTYESYVDAMDLENEYGPFRKYIHAQVSRMLDVYRDEYNKYRKEYVRLSKPIIEKIDFNKQILSPELGEGTYFENKAFLLGALLHTGNDSNKKKLLIGKNWGTLNEDGSLNDSKWQSFLNRMYDEGVITEEDMNYIQSLWDLMESLKDVSQPAYKKVYGHFFDEIKNTPIETPFGTYKGGYAPAATDPFDVRDITEKKELEKFMNERSIYMHPTAGGGGFGKNRVENYNKPLALDISLVPSHIEEVLRFSYVKPAVIDAVKIVMSKDFSEAMSEIDNEVISGLIKPALQRADKDSKQVDPPNTPSLFIRVSSYVKQNAAMQVLFANVVNVAEQTAGLAVAATRVHPRHISRAVWKYMVNPSKYSKQVMEAHPGMRTRGDAQLSLMEKHAKRIFEDKSNLKKVREWALEHAYFMQLAYQNHLDRIVFMAAYDQAIESGLTHDQSTEKAMSTVRQTMGSGRAFDVSRLMTNEWLNFFQMFMNFFNQMANVNATNFIKLYHQDMRMDKKFYKGMYLYMMGYASLAIISAALRKAAAGGLDEDDDGEVGDDLYDVFIGSQIDLGLAMVPVAGAPIKTGINRLNDKVYDDRVSTSPAVSVIAATVGTAGKIVTGDIKSKKGDINDAMTALGILTGTPLRPIGKPVNYVLDVQRGEARATGPVDIARGLLTGKPGTR